MVRCISSNICVRIQRLADIPFCNFSVLVRPHKLRKLHDRINPTVFSPEIVIKIKNTQLQMLIVYLLPFLNKVRILRDKTSCIGGHMAFVSYMVFCTSRYRHQNDTEHCKRDCKQCDVSSVQHRKVGIPHNRVFHISYYVHLYYSQLDSSCKVYNKNTINRN